MLGFLSIYAIPMQPNQTAVTSDLSILNYALTLEHLEATFYNQGMANFTCKHFTDAGFDKSVYAYFQQIQSHENTHVATLTSVIQSLNGTAVPVCQYDFKVTDVKHFVATAKALETTGVSAYIGASSQIIDKDLLTAAATILSVEARHAAYLRQISQQSPFPNPFDISLDQSEIVSIASQFIVQCPYTLPRAFPALTVDPASGKAGDRIAVRFNGSSDHVNCLFLEAGGNNTFAPVTNGSCVVPQSNMTDTYIILTNATTIRDFNDSSTLAGPASFGVAQ